MSKKKMEESKQNDASNALREIEQLAIPQIRWLQWGVIFASAVVVGVAIHGEISREVHQGALQVATTAIPDFSRNWDVLEAGSGPDKQEAAQLMLRQMGIQTDSVDKDVMGDLANAFDRMDGAPAPALSMAARLIGPGRSATGENPNCDADYVRAMAAIMARQLVGWPSDIGKELKAVDTFRAQRTRPAAAAEPIPAAADVAAAINQACNDVKAIRAPLIFGPFAGLYRSAPRSANDLAEIILTPDACLPGGDSTEAYTRCQLLKGLFRSAMDAEEVRASRLTINFIYGWERAAVIALAVMITLAIFLLWRARQPLKRQAAWLALNLQFIDNRLSPNNEKPREGEADTEAMNLHREFYRVFGKAGRPEGPPPFKWNGGLTVIRDILDATQESLHSPDRAHLEKFIELHTQGLARQRAFINALITAFPAIGLVATLDGLIHALSRASGIVAGTDATRFASTELVTNILSSSFATTMLALIFMAIFMLINVGEEHNEADLLESTHKRLLSVFWPGRTNGGPQPAPIAAVGRRA